MEAARLHMATDFSPYEAWAMTGRVTTTISRGETIVEDGEPCVRGGRGRFLARGNAAGSAVAR
jgi:dihydropyrimidinase